MTVQELITTLLEMPMDSEIVKSYSIEDDDGEEWTIEEEPHISQMDGKVWL